MKRQTRTWAGVGVSGVLLLMSTLAVANQEPSNLAERGRMLYAQHCAECHGAKGQGRVRGNATALNNSDFLAWTSDVFLLTTIARGRRGTEMAGWAREAGGPLGADDIHALVVFLRTWQQDILKPPMPRVGRGIADRGRRLYEMACANCHDWEGRGELGMGPALNNPDFLEAADDAFLWATIAYGRRGDADVPLVTRARRGAAVQRPGDRRPRGLSAGMATAAVNKGSLWFRVRPPNGDKPLRYAIS